MADRTVSVVMRAQVDGYTRPMQEAAKATESVKASVDKSVAATDVLRDRMNQSTIASRLLTGAIAGVGSVAALSMGKAMVSAASNLNESLSKTNAVFGSSAAAVQAWSKTTADAMGISQQASAEAASTFGNLFTAMKIGQKPAADMSMKLVNLAGDLASFNNVSPADALEALRAGLVGEVEPLRRFGVNLSQAALQAEAASSGIVKASVDMTALKAAQLTLMTAQERANKVAKDAKATDDQRRAATMAVTVAEGRLADVMKGKVPQLTAAQQAQAAYKLIMAQTATAQGDAARTGDQVAGAQRRLTAQWEDAQAQLGTALLPTMQAGIGILNDLLGAFNALPGPVKDLTVVTGLLGGALTMLAPKLVAVRTLASGIGTSVAGEAEEAATAVGGLRGTIGKTASLLGAAGPWGVAIAGAIGLGGLLVGALGKQDAAWQDNTTLIGENRQALEEHNKAVVIDGVTGNKELLSSLERLHIPLNEYTAAILGNKAAQTALRAQIDQVTGAQTTNLTTMKGWSKTTTTEVGSDLKRVTGTFNDLSGSIDSNTSRWQLNQQAMAGYVGWTNKAIAAQQKLSQTIAPGRQGQANAGRRAGGGPVDGPGTKTSDSVPMMLSRGEYVMQASAVDRYGPNLMAQINAGAWSPTPGYAQPVPVAPGAGGTTVILHRYEERIVLEADGHVLATVLRQHKADRGGGPLGLG